MIHRIEPDALVDMSLYRSNDRTEACDRKDPLEILVAYATTDKSVNQFGQLYREDAPLCLHHSLADIVVDAAIHLHHTQGWRLRLYDGLRTVDTQLAMKHSSDVDPDWFRHGMLSTPGSGAHPKGMAIDLMAIDAHGKELDVGTGFDALDPVRAPRIYNGDGISETAKENRLAVEAAMLRAAFARGRLLAPLRSEHWDYRFPEDLHDGWRVLESVARVARIPFPKTAIRMEIPDYTAFKKAWRLMFSAHTATLLGTIGTEEPPANEETILYHGQYAPLTDSDLPPAYRQSRNTFYAEPAHAVVEAYCAAKPDHGRSPVA